MISNIVLFFQIIALQEKAIYNNSLHFFLYMFIALNTHAVCSDFLILYFLEITYKTDNDLKPPVFSL